MSREKYPILPYQYAIIFTLFEYRLTAHELACDWRLKHLCLGSGNPTRSMVNRLRPLIARGWVRLNPDDPASGIYELTPWARAVLVA